MLEKIQFYIEMPKFGRCCTYAYKNPQPYLLPMQGFPTIPNTTEVRATQVLIGSLPDPVDP